MNPAFKELTQALATAIAESQKTLALVREARMLVEGREMVNREFMTEAQVSK